MSEQLSKPLFAPRGDRDSIEEGQNFCPKFGADGLIPAVVTDFETGELLMQAFMNAQALALTLQMGEAVYWSRSRQELWHKGQTSGNVQVVREIRTDCDQDCIWLRVEQKGGGACHTGYRSCFYRCAHFGKDLSNETAGRLYYADTERKFDPKDVYGSANPSRTAMRHVTARESDS